MKLTLDPMPVLRQAKADEVTMRFNQMAAARTHTDQAYAQKRAWAEVCDARLQPEAELRGMTVLELAAAILAKPDTVAARELQRVQLLRRIAASTTPAELNAIAVSDI
ncbi:hypothetical protein [Bradyrhizobium sp. SZCCHNR2032]|uniref:hypothetical protein n=1 Tax=Bradyrhizobium sp. SZCCHNR2032 TaxID=3057384 RepID=UPI002916986B|nr:hypothetical protein [Bradyrhizobium sp. SZCCHNR2032]